MLKFIIELAISAWLTSSLFMLIFWANAFIATYRNNKKILLMPLGRFLYIHFCPIAHSIYCWRIMRRYEEMKNAQKEQRGV